MLRLSGYRTCYTIIVVKSFDYYGTSLLLDIDDCARQPCQNGGTCTDAVNNYTCNCVAGYSGKNCSVGEYKFYFLNNCV